MTIREQYVNSLLRFRVVVNGGWCWDEGTTWESIE
jgi:hypothetical protein